MARIKVAIVGVGNCASALIQGICYYGADRKDLVGLRNLRLGTYRPGDVEIVNAFDIDKRKVGKDLSKAIFSDPNNAPRLINLPSQGVIVEKGPVLDGVGEYTSKVIHVSSKPEVNVCDFLKRRKAEIMLNLLPSGALKASDWYAEQALEAGCGFVNITPNSIATDVSWQRHFKKAGLPLVGDDLIDQVGSTTLHKSLLSLLSMQGVHITETYQLDVGGGAESLDTLDRTRDLKRIVKTESVEAALPYKSQVVAGSTDYVDFLRNRRDSYFWIRGSYFGCAPMQLDMKLSTVDAPNAGSMLLDVVRATKIALDRKLSGAIKPICSYAFKHPPSQASFEMAEKEFADFVKTRA